MNIQFFRSLWGVDAGLAQAAAEAAQAGFSGLESRVPTAATAWSELEQALQRHGLLWNAEIVTGGDYVPRRNDTPQQHLAELESAVRSLAPFRPVRVNCITGLDAWDFQTALEYLERAHEVGEKYGVALCFETHRSRILFNPWVTRALLQKLPGLRLTADISHWCVVAERQMDTEMEVMEAIAPHVRHVHGRVGYDQGPQVPHPASPLHGYCLEAHQRCWELFWQAARDRGDGVVTMTPEFGSDGYLQCLPFTGQPVADLWEINQWMALTEQSHFSRWESASHEQSTC